MKDYRSRITVNPKVHFGKPYIIGTRITVDNVLELIQEGIPFNEITQNYYPDLKIEDIRPTFSTCGLDERKRYAWKQADGIVH